MGLQLGDAGLVLPKNFMESTRIQGVGVHKRAYAKLTFIKRVAEYVKGCPGSITTIESGVQSTKEIAHSKIQADIIDTEVLDG